MPFSPPHHDETIWTVFKKARSASAVLRHIEGVGIELRFLWNGDLRESRLYRNATAAGDALMEATERRRDLESRGWQAVSERPNMATHGASPTEPLVLLVDDATDDLEMYSVALTSQGFRTRCTNDIETALQLASAERPAIVVTDLHLPCLDGLVLLDSIWAALRTRGIPVIVVTADGTDATREKVRAFRPAEFHVKPLAPDLLVAAIRRVLATEKQPTSVH